MNLIKTSSLTAISTVVRIITSFIVGKVIAVYIGPVGIAMLGQFQNFVSIVTTFANGAINGGIVKYVAEYHDNEPKRSKILSTSLLISCAFALTVSIIIAISHSYLSYSLFKDHKYDSVILVFAFTLIIFSLNTYFVSVLNGFKEIKKFVWLNIISSIVSLVFTVFLVIYFGLYGALLSLATAQTVVFFVTVFFVISSDWFHLDNFIGGFDKESLIKLGKFSLMSIISATITPASQILVRNYIVDQVSADAAGYWQGVWKISDIYLMLIVNSISVYYLPRLSELKTNSELKKEIFNGYKILLPIVICMALGVYLIREPLILALFTKKFMPMMELFKYQLLGDILKMAAWILSYLMVAKAMTRWFIATEIVFNCLFVFLSMWLINNFGLVGVTQAFALNAFIYLLLMIFLFRKIIFGKSEQNC